jgi:GGDEF domain-containing protein
MALPHVTISCGTAATNEHAETSEAPVSAADGALYSAKKAGQSGKMRFLSGAVSSIA